jgi:FkbM family methyltransferase
MKPVEKEWGVTSQWVPANMRKRGLAPATVLDIGAARGTPELYEAFPDAYHVLIEPLVEFEDKMKEQLTRYRGEYVLTAVGADEGTATIQIAPGMPLTSTIKEIEWLRPNPSRPRIQREIPVTTIDKLVRERGWAPPFGLKMDTEGYEREVIEGATNTLRETQFVIAEVAVERRFSNSYTFAEFISLLDDHGFCVCDVLDAPRPRQHRELVCMDILFWRKDLRRVSTAGGRAHALPTVASAKTPSP